MGKQLFNENVLLICLGSLRYVAAEFSVQIDPAFFLQIHGSHQRGSYFCDGSQVKHLIFAGGLPGLFPPAFMISNSLTSDESRVGIECVITFRSRGWPYP